jgi:hypothetical protein
MSDLMIKHQEQLDQALVLAEKLNKEKSYLVNLLIKSNEPSVTKIINQYLDWLEENER